MSETNFLSFSEAGLRIASDRDCTPESTLEKKGEGRNKQKLRFNLEEEPR